ncbi:unnamed protein product [Mucor hiemalis]
MRGSNINVSVFDNHLNRPGSNVVMILEKMSNGIFCPISQSRADSNGHCNDLVRKGYLLTSGLCHLMVDLNAIFQADERRFKFPYISVRFWIIGRPEDSLTIKIVLHESSYIVQ